MASNMTSTTLLPLASTTAGSSHMELRQYVKSVYKFYAVCGYTLSPVIVLANILLIITILSDNSLRRSFRHVAMLSIAVTDIFIGLVSLPIKGDLLLLNRVHSCMTMFIASVFEYYIQLFVSTWTIVIINADVIVSLMKIKLPDLSTQKRNIISGFLILLPWVLDFVAILPPILLHMNKKRTGPMCYVFQTEDVSSVVGTLSFVLPGVCILFQIAAIIFALRKRRFGSLVNESPYLFILVSTLTVLLIGLEQSTFMVQSRLNDLPPKRMFEFLVAAVLMSDARSAVVPILWFLLPELRASLRTLVRKLCSFCKKEPMPHTNSVTYKEMSEETNP